ncbi:MAG: 4Fe-4S ferredoxin [Candidatus Methanomethylicota archaeon]|uniref:4Fe-4S ferredoxin n=1 Tax=Thermoproteota archaeon TaxID=2056631 RepID=A0A497F223_9CREN|nr:MAG: 4Fe-4S ferredoxin [Candidatus Verstraetearchaeota archaeon]
MKPKLLRVWVKAPILKKADLLIIGECAQIVNPKVVEELGKGKVVLTYCPEGEGQLAYGKIASIIRASKPSSITVLTVDGSPHCLLVHAAVNEAIFEVGEKIKQKHYVLVNGEKLAEISPDAIRVARYLSLVQKLIDKNPEILKELEKLSLEYKYAKKQQ